MSEEKEPKLKKHQKDYREANRSRKSQLDKKCMTISITNF